MPDTPDGLRTRIAAALSRTPEQWAQYHGEKAIIEARRNHEQ